MNVHEVKSIETKSILSRLKSKDNYWGIAYNMNLYRGFQHGCIYCEYMSFLIYRTEGEIEMDQTMRK